MESRWYWLARLARRCDAMAEEIMVDRYSCEPKNKHDRQIVVLYRKASQLPQPPP